jgi:hypothetical protein
MVPPRVSSEPTRGATPPVSGVSGLVPPTHLQAPARWLPSPSWIHEPALGLRPVYFFLALAGVSLRTKRQT